MDNEEKTNEAEPTKPGVLTDSIERMKSVLDAVESEVRQARFLFPNLATEGLKWATLSRACGKIHDLTRLGWQQLVDPAAGTGEFFTKKETLDFLAGNPPFGDVKDAATPLDPSVQTGGGCNGNRGNSYMSKPEAAYILCRMATSRKCDVSGVTALQMGVRSLMKRHFDRQRNWARRRTRAAGEAEEKQNV